MKKENLNDEKEKMIKKTKSIGDVIEICVYLLIIMIALGIISGIIDGIIMWKDGYAFIDIVKEWTSFYNIEIDFSTNKWIVECIARVIKIVVTIVGTMALAKVFLNTAKEETPFTIENIKNLRKISCSAIIIFWVSCFIPNSGIGAIYVCAICGIEYIFRYGYKLQLESDETL